jgi:hypothetical protein
MKPNSTNESHSVSADPSKVDAAKQMPIFLAERWKSACSTAGSLPTAERIWHLVFTDDERDQLGGDFSRAINEIGTVRMWRKVRGGTEIQSIVAMNRAIGQLDQPHADAILRHFGERPQDRPKLRMAIRQCTLVIDEVTRTAWWHSNQIDVDWYRENKPWELLALLAEKALTREGVDVTDLDPSRRYKDGYLKSLKGRMLGIANFPKDMDDFILSEGRGTYRLKLAPTEVQVFLKGE